MLTHIFCSFILVFVADVRADGIESPLIQIEVESEIEFQGTVSKNENKTSFLTTEIESYATLTVMTGLTVEAHMVFERDDDLDDDRSHYFEGAGLFAEQLYMAYETHNLRFFAGKFNPAFGVAWQEDIALGPFGQNLAEDYYEQTERIGVGLSYAVASKTVGTHILTVQSFFADTTILSRSFFANRGRTRKSDGGLANTEDLSSFSINLDGNLSITGMDLRYSLGYLKNASGVSETSNEQGLAIALYGGFDVTDDIRFEPMLEYVKFSNAEGIAQDRNIITFGTTIWHNSWNMAFSYSRLHNHSKKVDVTDINTDILQMSVGYDLQNGFRLDIGYKYEKNKTNNANINTQILGFILKHEFETIF